MKFDILEVSEKLGHESVQTTWDTYSHLYPDKDQKLAGWMSCGNQKELETLRNLWYIKDTESTHSKVDAPKQKVIYLSTRGASPVDQTGGALFFSLASLIEKGKQRNY